MGIRSKSSTLVVSALFAIAPARSQTVVATDETMGVQLVEITNWNMSATVPWENADKALYPAPAFGCGKAVAISTTILSDPTANGQPYVENFVRMNRLMQIKKERGGDVEVQCYQGSPGLLGIYFHQRHLDPGQTTYFISATLMGKSFRFESTSARRGWMKFEYYQ